MTDILRYEFQLPRPGLYLVRCAVGDALKAVTGQQLQVYDGATLIKTLFTNAATSAADFYLDAHGSNVSAAQWPSFNQGVVLVFQTTQAIFQIGDGTSSTYVALLQIEDVTRAERQRGVRLRPFKRTVIRPWFRRKLLPLNIIQPQRQLEKGRKLPVFRRRKPLRLLAKRYPISKVVFRTPLRKGNRAFWRRRRPVIFRHKLFVPVPPPPPFVLPWRPRPRAKIKRRVWKGMYRKYPNIGFVTPIGHVTLGSKIVVMVQ